MKIKVKSRNVYSKDLFYPNCEVSRTISNIAKTKTLSMEVLTSLEKIGFNIECEIETIKPNWIK